MVRQPVHLTPAQLRLLLLGVAVLLVLLLLALCFELAVTRAALLYVRLTGKQPPRHTLMGGRLAELEHKRKLRR